MAGGAQRPRRNVRQDVLEPVFVRQQQRGAGAQDLVAELARSCRAMSLTMAMESAGCQGTGGALKEELGAPRQALGVDLVMRAFTPAA